MGGGDLNSKKSWHPNTIKNQERVWKAEQAAAEETRRIAELQRERAMERDRAELSELAKRAAGDSAADGRLNWMYEKPDKSTQHEDYLLGKAIDKNFDKPENQESEIPAVARRVVGSSMLASAGDVQVDLARKLREDPLLLVKERERAARAALLNNPLHRHRLTELLRKEQAQKKENKSKKKEKKNLDKMLADKLSALGGDKGVDLSALLATDSDSSTDTSTEEKPKKKKKKKQSKRKSKKSKHERQKSDEDTNSDADLSDVAHKLKIKDKNHDRKNKKRSDEKNFNYKTEKYTSPNNQKESRKRKSDSSESDVDSKRRKEDSNKAKSEVDRADRIKFYGSYDKRSRGRRRSESPDKERERKRDKAADSKLVSDRQNKYESSERRREGRMETSTERYSRAKGAEDEVKRQRSGMSEEERAAKLAAMATAGAERESTRARRVAQQRADGAAEEQGAQAKRRAPAPGPAALPDSLEARIHSNRHYIQRNSRHMNEHFARR